MRLQRRVTNAMCAYQCVSQNYLSITKNSSSDLSDLRPSKPLKKKREAGLLMKKVAPGWVEERGLMNIALGPRRDPLLM